ncbi:MAG: Clp protease [Clostridiales bacterium]|nr:Clp protease [Clostridiales bacterium]
MEKNNEKEDEINNVKEFGNTAIISPKEKIQVVPIIGEIEGHMVSNPQTKTTKYEHLIPLLVSMEQNENVKGILLILNTVGGDVESGLAIAEMVASLNKPTVSLVLGGSHSIGVPLATCTDYSFIVPTGTMIIHPIRMSGTVIGASQTFDYFKKIQDRITDFITDHCKISKERLEELMSETGVLTKDIGTILIGKETIEEGIIDEVGGIKEAIKKLNELIEEK